MKVTLPEGLSAFLELYDHHFASQLRSDYKLEPWNERLEKSHSDFVISANGAELSNNLQYNNDFEEPEEGWSPEENEIYSQDKCIDMFKTEVAVYDALKSLQGKQIPYLFAQVTLSHTDNYNQHTEQTGLREINGVLFNALKAFPCLKCQEIRIGKGGRASLTRHCESSTRYRITRFLTQTCGLATSWSRLM